MIDTTLIEFEESESKNTGGLSHKPLPKLTDTKIYHRALSMSHQIEKLLKDTLIDFKSLQDDFAPAIDSTGLKIYNGSEWRSKKRSGTNRKWLKLRVVVDIQTNQVVAFSLTESRVHDSKEGIVLVEEIVRASQEEGKRAKKVLADKGYCTHKMFSRLRELGIETGIVPRKG